MGGVSLVTFSADAPEVGSFTGAWFTCMCKRFMCEREDKKQIKLVFFKHRAYPSHGSCSGSDQDVGAFSLL